MNDIQSIIKKIDKLAPIPRVAHKFLDASKNEGRSMKELSQIVSYDAVITANILKVVNSAYFGLQKKIESVQQAAVYLGMEQIVDIVFMVSSPKELKTKQKGYGLNDGDLWKYSISSALISKNLAERINTEDSQMIFTSALLKDIGKVILNQHVEDSFDQINQMVVEKDLSFREAEEKVIGIDHAELGGMVAEAWNFSPKMVEIIRNHHDPRKSQISGIETSIVYMADVLCMMMGIGGGADGLAYRFHREIVDRLKLTDADIIDILADFSDKLNDVESLMDM